jgi:NAD(P)-dependent dehydrogenase (short-subunit alcohol dehydrogenase family)
MHTVLITGASRGIGQELARQYAADSWNVIATVRDSRDGAKLAAFGSNVAVYIAEVTDHRSLARLAANLKGAPVDVLICNAGILGPLEVEFGKTDYAVWEDMFRVNVMGVMATAEALIENVAASALKSIVIISSGAGSLTQSDRPFATRSTFLYRSTKAALNSVMRSISVLVKERGVIAVSMTPGWTRTDMGGPDAPLSAQDSVSGMRKVIAGLTPAHSSHFYRHTGEEVPW